MAKDWVAIVGVCLALLIVGLIYLRGVVSDDLPVAGNSIESLSNTSSTGQTIIGIVLLFVLVISIFVVVNTSGALIKQHFHKN